MVVLKVLTTTVRVLTQSRKEFRHGLPVKPKVCASTGKGINFTIPQNQDKRTIPAIMEYSFASGHQLRKAEHLSICASRQVEPEASSAGFEEYRFVHEALPEIDFESVDTRCRLFGREMRAPFIISPMTGGIPEAGSVNRRLAEAAQAFGIAMGVGSQRVAILDHSAAESFRVRDVAPDIFLFANVGAIQLNNGFSVDECRAAVDMIEADALGLHLNPLQEVVQSGGNTNFAGLIRKIEEVCAKLDVPVVVKEVGQGISERTARMLCEAGVAGIDTAGAGGTSWALVESFRERNGRSGLGAAFADWGIPTAESIVMARRGAPDVVLIGSGGVRSGIDAAKAVALGADFVGFGLPILREAVNGADAVVRLLDRYLDELRVAMFCIGAASLDELKLTRSLTAVSDDDLTSAT